MADKQNKTIDLSPADNPKIADENADWLKRLEGGKYQKEDLAAHDAISKTLTTAEVVKRGGLNDLADTLKQQKEKKQKKRPPRSDKFSWNPGDIKIIKAGEEEKDEEE